MADFSAINPSMVISLYCTSLSVLICIILGPKVRCLGFFMNAKKISGNGKVISIKLAGTNNKDDSRREVEFLYYYFICLK